MESKRLLMKKKGGRVWTNLKHPYFRHVKDYILQINEMKGLLEKKSSNLKMIQDGIKNINEFEKTQMEQMLSDMSNSRDIVDSEHRESLKKWRIDSSKGRHSENMHLKEVLRDLLRGIVDLWNLKISMEKQNALLEPDKDTLKLKVKQDKAQMKAKKEELSKLRAKIVSPDQALELKIKDCEQEEKEKEKILVKSQEELEKLKKVVAMPERELCTIKRQECTFVTQRRELHQFFSESLNHVRQEIMASRMQYKEAAQEAHCWRRREATAGRQKFPPICTFNKNPHSANSA